MMNSAGYRPNTCARSKSRSKERSQRPTKKSADMRPKSSLSRSALLGSSSNMKSLSRSISSHPYSGTNSSLVRMLFETELLLRRGSPLSRRTSPSQVHKSKFSSWPSSLTAMEYKIIMSRLERPHQRMWM